MRLRLSGPMAWARPFLYISAFASARFSANRSKRVLLGDEEHPHECHVCLPPHQLASYHPLQLHHPSQRSPRLPRQRIAMDFTSTNCKNQKWTCEGESFDRGCAAADPTTPSWPVERSDRPHYRVLMCVQFLLVLGSRGV